MSNVVSLEQYRSETQRTDEEAAAKAAELSTMSYYDLLVWAGTDFDRLVAVAKAKDYRPEWIAHQLEERDRPPTPSQVAVLGRMIADAGAFVSRRQRWILRQLRAKPMSESALVKLASKSTEYAQYKHPDRCLRHDIAKLVERHLIQTRGGLVYYVMADSGAAPAQPRLIGGGT